MNHHDAEIDQLKQERDQLKAEVERLRNTSKQCSYPIWCDYVSELEQERDQLKARLGHCQRFLASGVLYTYDELLRHDAEVIEQVTSELAIKARDGYHRVEYQSGYLAAVNDVFAAANRLRQQGQDDDVMEDE